MKFHRELLPSVLPKSSIMKNNTFEESRLFPQSEEPVASLIFQEKKISKSQIIQLLEMKTRLLSKFIKFVLQ
ncbi:hypothetical protein EA458_04225 [Streptococcus dysgalactiae subsp. dysgalactiae]|nr:hypothetical protein EA458_04225 [Streptococcus dysgalactiae subsp. dysgalactiae]